MSMHEYICDSCLAKEEEPQNNGLASLGFFHNIALQLHFPFQAIALISDCARSRKAKNFNIRIVKMENSPQLQLSPETSYEENYVEIKFDGTVLTNKEATRVAHYYPLPDYDFSFYSIIGMLGLGKTSLLICNDGKYLKTILFSVDDRINPSYSKSPQGYFFIEEIATGKIQNLGGEHQKTVISQICKIFHVDTKTLFSCQEGWFKILIFHGKIFVTSKKIMFYELSESQFNRDIEIYHNSFKFQFLDKIGYELSNHAEISFASYYSLLYLNPTLKLKIGNNQQEFHGLTYETYLEKLQKNGMISRIDCQMKMAKKCILYKAKENYFAHNNGILLYSRGRLINRYETDFGKMMEQCFYKKKYRRPPKNFFQFLGVIDFNEKIEPNLILTKFNPSCPNYQQFIFNLNHILYEGGGLAQEDKPLNHDEEVRVTRSSARCSEKKEQNSAHRKSNEKEEQEHRYGEPRKKVKTDKSHDH